ncbi:Hsp70 family protein [Alkalihalobacillus sp. R86527]|uniref:Hsp70 family protein n=1 Tax=Alkalihalobacillus sp. R86527 TaxID=3093863 RepID=UPI0036732A00
MARAIGIDLGTSNTAVAIYRKGKVESIPLEGRMIMPSVVSYRKKDDILVGNAAKSRLYIDPMNSVSSSKRYIGTDRTYSIHGDEITPVEVAKELLIKVREEASKYLKEDVKDAVITIPAYFTDEQRKATKEAGELAGFNVLRLLPEPTAAAIAYGLEKERNQTIMVYDLGGGTFDVSILKVTHNNFEVLAVDGDSMLGGDDFDEEIVRFLLDKLNFPIHASQGVQGSMIRQQLKEAAEEAKKELSESEFTDITIPDIYGQHLDEELSKESFEEMIDSLVQKTVDKLNEVLKSAGLTKRDISRVILVGGSTRIHAVQKAVASKIKQPFIADNVDEIVAQGAAIMAANLAAPNIDSTPVPINVEDVTAHSFGVDLLDDEVDRMKVFHLIRKNSKLPCTGSILGWTIRPYQTEIAMGVFRTEEDIPYQEDKLGELVLPVSRKSYNVTNVALFELDVDGILTFSSGEIDRVKGSDLIQEYIDTQKVNLKKIKNMIDRSDLQLKTITIDTTKQEAMK